MDSHSPLPGATKTKPGAATLPFFGIDVVLLDPTTGKEIEGNEVEGVLAVRKPWPSIARTVYGDHKRFLETYMNVYPGYYFTGDGAGRDHDGYCESLSCFLTLRKAEIDCTFTTQTGSEDELTTSSTYLVTVSQLLKSNPL